MAEEDEVTLGDLQAAQLVLMKWDLKMRFVLERLAEKEGGELLSYPLAVRSSEARDLRTATATCRELIRNLLRRKSP